MVENAIFLQIFHMAIQPKVANSGNQKPQPQKHHHHTTTTTTKIKITQKSKSHRERDRWVEDRWVEGEIAQRRDRRCDRRVAIGAERSSDWSSRDRAARCDRRTGAREIEWHGAIVGLELTRSTGVCDWRGLELRVRVRSSDWTGARWPPLSLSLSLSLRR